VDAPPVQPQQRRQLRRRQTHHAVDLRPAEDAVLQPLGEQAQTRSVPKDQFDPVRALGDGARERIGQDAFVAPSTSISIIPTSGLDLHRGSMIPPRSLILVDDLFVDPMAAIVTPPDLSEDKAARNRSSRDDQPP
jgi:hypothetical protein